MIEGAVLQRDGRMAVLPLPESHDCLLQSSLLYEHLRLCMHLWSPIIHFDTLTSLTNTNFSFSICLFSLCCFLPALSVGINWDHLKHGVSHFNACVGSRDLQRKRLSCFHKCDGNVPLISNLYFL